MKKEMEILISGKEKFLRTHHSFIFFNKNKRKINRTNKFISGEQSTSTKKSTSTEKQFEFGKNSNKQNGRKTIFLKKIIFSF